MEPYTKLAFYRRRAGYKQKEVAKILGISVNTLLAYEKGKSKIPFTVFVKICEIYDCDVFDIFGVHADDIIYDVPFIEVIRAHARFVIKKERDMEIKAMGEPFPDVYYENKYDAYVNKMASQYGISDQS